ncbi:response regulator transcription factor [Micrococcaceae bacterium Sec5.8]
MDDIRVLVVEDQALMSQALKVFIDAAPGMACVGIAEDGRSAVSMTARLRPDVVLMDMQLPLMDGAEATARILASDHCPAILAVTTFATDEYLVPAFRAGVQGFLVKDSRPAEIAAAVQQAHAGATVVSPQVTAALVKALVAEPLRTCHAAAPLREPLTGRESEVLALIGQGLSNRDVANALFVTEATVKAHAGRLMAKFGVENRVQLVVCALKLGVLTL